MTAEVQPARREPANYYLEFDHTEALARVVSAISVFDPVKSAISYLVPWVTAWVSNQIEIRRDDRLQTSLMTPAAKRALLDTVDALKIAAGIDRDVGVFTSLDQNCTSYGGTLSLTRPIISIPRPLLTLPSESIFENGENPAEPLDEPPAYWTFSPDEVSFFIARGLAHIKSNDALIRIASKVLFVASLFFFFALHVTAFACIALMLGAAVLYIISERFVQGKLDIKAIDILSRYFDGDENRAIEAGTGALEKLIQQNIERKERKPWWCGFYLTKKGTNWLDLDNPWLPNRLDTVREHYNVPVPAEEPILAH